MPTFIAVIKPSLIVAMVSFSLRQDILPSAPIGNKFAVNLYVSPTLKSTILSLIVIPLGVKSIELDMLDDVDELSLLVELELPPKENSHELKAVRSVVKKAASFNLFFM